MPEPPTPDCNDLIEITHVASPHRFWFKYRHAPDNDVGAWEDELQTHFTATASYFPADPYKPQIGEQIVAYIVSMDRWVRASCDRRNVYEEDRCTYSVWTIDHGKPFEVDSHWIRAFPPSLVYNFKDTVFMAAIADVAPACEMTTDDPDGDVELVQCNEWSPTAIMLIEQLIADSSQIEFIRRHVTAEGLHLGDLIFTTFENTLQAKQILLDRREAVEVLTEQFLDLLGSCPSRWWMPVTVTRENKEDSTSTQGMDVGRTIKRCESVEMIIGDDPVVLVISDDETDETVPPPPGFDPDDDYCVYVQSHQPIQKVNSMATKSAPQTNTNNRLKRLRSNTKIEQAQKKKSTKRSNLRLKNPWHKRNPKEPNPYVARFKRILDALTRQVAQAEAAGNLGRQLQGLDLNTSIGSSMADICTDLVPYRPTTTDSTTLSTGDTTPSHNLQIGISPGHRQMRPGQFAFLLDAFRKLMLKSPDQLPQFCSHHFRDGYFRVGCANEKAANWMKQFIREIVAAGNSPKFDIVQYNSILATSSHELITWIAGHKIKNEKILCMLRTLNPTVDLRSWKIVASSRAVNSNNVLGHNVVFRVDGRSLNQLKSCDMTLRYSFFALRFQCLADE